MKTEEPKEYMQKENSRLQTEKFHLADRKFPSCRWKNSILQTEKFHLADRKIPSCRQKNSILQTETFHLADRKIPSCRQKNSILQTCRRPESVTNAGGNLSQHKGAKLGKLETKKKCCKIWERSARRASFMLKANLNTSCTRTTEPWTSAVAIT